MIASVGSRGSPLPKSISSTPCAARRRFAWSSFTNGYVPVAARVGESCIGLDGTQETLQGLVGAHQLRDLDLLIAAMGVPRGAGPEVDGVEALRCELRHGRPGLLRLDRKAARLAQPPRQLGIDDDVRRR